MSCMRNACWDKLTQCKKSMRTHCGSLACALVNFSDTLTVLLPFQNKAVYNLKVSHFIV